MNRQRDKEIVELLGYRILPNLGVCKFERDVEDYQGLVADRWVTYKDGIVPHYSTDSKDMLELIAELKVKLLFSQRLQFRSCLREYVSEGIGVSIHTDELIWFLTPDTVSRAAHKVLTDRKIIRRRSDEG